MITSGTIFLYTNSWRKSIVSWQTATGQHLNLPRTMKGLCSSPSLNEIWLILRGKFGIKSLVSHTASIFWTILTGLASQQILLDMVSLQLGTFYFFMKEHTEVRKLGLLKAYTTAVSVISKSVEADKAWGFLKNAPNGYLQILCTGAILVMKIVHSSYSQYIDVDEGKRAFDSIVALKLTAPDKDYDRDDLRDRIRRVLEQLWSLHHSLTLAREREPSLRVKSRLGASVMHDALWTFRDQHSISVSDLVRPEPSK
jgi:hypothetical protein